MAELIDAHTKRPERVNPRRFQTTNAIIAEVISKKTDSNEKEKYEGMLTNVFERLSLLLEEGGVITTTGVMMPKEVSLAALSDTERKAYEEDRYATTRAAALRDASSLDIKALELHGREKAFHINSGFDEWLTWRPLHNKARKIYLSKSDGSIVDMEPLVTAYANFLAGQAYDNGIPIDKDITPSALIETFLIETSQVIGKGQQTNLISENNF